MGLRRALSYCEEHAHEPVSVADIAEAAGMGVRALQLRFRRELGVTPLAHLRMVRLERAHRELLAIGRGEMPGTVTEVACRWGFTHLGRFSEEYWRVYHWHPSQVVRRNQSPPSVGRPTAA